MSAIKPIHLYSHAGGPNPWKVVIILEELSIPFTTEFVDFKEIHTPKFEQYNPNGRVPIITDPNTGITLWESGAIINYLIQTYDRPGPILWTDGMVLALPPREAPFSN
jgi:glutathione S-transferase